MASAVIHICVANELNKELKKDKNKLLIGSIAPDISKTINEDRKKSHFISSGDNVVLSKFLSKYSNNLNDDFVLGYYIHLCTDYLWFKYFLPKIVQKNIIYKLDGTTAFVDNETLYKYIYNDYTNLNVELIDEYNLDLSIFYEPCPKLKNIIKEIPMDKIEKVIDAMGVIIENSTKNSSYIFDSKIIKEFIDSSVSAIRKNLQNIL